MGRQNRKDFFTYHAASHPHFKFITIGALIFFPVNATYMHQQIEDYLKS